MLEAGIKEQLTEVFARLEGEVVLRAAPSRHAQQAELLELLRDVADLSDKVRVELAEGAEQAAPSFAVVGARGAGGITFRGVPGGHEFTSLVLAILHVDGQGRQPDAGVAERIRALKGPIRLTTYVSLSCENCPAVVQALNLMATLHPDFTHETVDGAVASDEIERLGIQGVPSVIHDGKLLNSGKIDLVDLLARLEERLGRSATAATGGDLGTFDVVVVGGGPAGASSAIYSARKGLKTAIVAERLGGQLKETLGIQNMISVPYTEGVRLAAQLEQHVADYPVQVFEHRRVKHIAGEVTKHLELESGETLQARTIIVATGARWRMLGVPGEKEYLGQGVAYCAHCDGPFYRGKRVAVVGGGNSGVEAAIDLAAIAEHVTLLEFTDRLKADDVLVAKLNALPNARVLLGGRATEVLGDGRKVVGLAYEERTSGALQRLEVDGVFVQIGLLPNSAFLRDVVALAPSGEIVVDGRGRTSVPGIYAAGDVTTVPFKQIVIAMGDGARVALSAFEDRMRAAA